MKNLFKVLIAIISLVLLSNCTAQEKQTPSAKPILDIAIHQKVKIPNSNTYLEFINIQEDSRCPPDVNCIWQGIAIVDINLTTGSKTESFQLASMDFPQKNATQSYSAGGYRFTLENLISSSSSKGNTTPRISVKYQKQ